MNTGLTDLYRGCAPFYEGRILRSGPRRNSEITLLLKVVSFLSNIGNAYERSGFIFTDFPGRFLWLLHSQSCVKSSRLSKHRTNFKRLEVPPVRSGPFPEVFPEERLTTKT